MCFTQLYVVETLTYELKLLSKKPRPDLNFYTRHLKIFWLEADPCFHHFSASNTI